MSRKPCRILLIAKQFAGVGGAARSAFDVLDAFAANRYHITVISSHLICLKSRMAYRGSKVGWYYSRGHENITFQWRIGALKRNVKWLLTKYHKFRTKRALENFDFVVVNSLGSHSVYASLKDNIHAAKSILIVRESPRHFGGSFQRQSLESAMEMLRQYDYHIFVSSICGDDWAMLGAVDRKKTFYVPNCAPEDDVQTVSDVNCQQARESLGIKPSEFFVLCVGTLQHRKGQDLILDQWGDLRRKIPEIVLCFAGSVKTDEGKSCCDRITNELQGERIKLLGYRSDALTLIKAADAVILPSRSEAMPRVILEAMALKTAVVASDVDGNSELLEHQKSGLLFSLEEPEKMVDLLCQLARKPETRRRLAHAAYDRYWEKFSRSHQIERYGEVMSLLLKDSC